MFRANVNGNIVLREAAQGAIFLALFCGEFDDDILQVCRPLVKFRTGFTMARPQNHAASVQELVAQFLSVSLAQYDALYVVDTKI
jgi:hypothetical protein